MGGSCHGTREKERSNMAPGGVGGGWGNQAFSDLGSIKIQKRLPYTKPLLYTP
uniref:Uncharacterized protein n=1 Tax=Anguilla anguilla TaxID=7936 RepID=A0A0E9VQN7_ANGAN